MKITRRNALKSLAGITLTGTFGLPTLAKSHQPKKEKRTFKHSVCEWAYGDHSLEAICKAAVNIGIDSIELLNPDQWPVVQKYGLTCAMANGSDYNIPKGFNNLEYHEKLQNDYADLIPKAAEAGLPNIICFSGNREGMDDQVGLEHCAKGLEPVVKLAEEHDITVCMELLNSKVDHPDYMCDHTEWGVELVDKVGSDRFKLLYDIYHMQIMEGDIIATIRKYSNYIGHYHTGGVPGRNEIDDTQELNYKAIMEAISETGFEGFVGQEFIPSRDDDFASLRQGVEICNV
ncbi:hydroxypyruvate isomerase family protein [Gracilimonas mengyeensis]|uniref:Hydroxypyruvate isomerase n=1 Tax=Gracilimonas mengyeensis TaxID=1302730 RepID=A0A521EAF4_9BACT|nr:TIM barrel protein [Gracilimonas mengyeensis]SMO80928.1 hydroxypyruvate isomerase [Gracilimonas mengyeensis]